MLTNTPHVRRVQYNNDVADRATGRRRDKLFETITFAPTFVSAHDVAALLYSQHLYQPHRSPASPWTVTRQEESSYIGLSQSTSCPSTVGLRSHRPIYCIQRTVHSLFLASAVRYRSSDHRASSLYKIIRNAQNSICRRPTTQNTVISAYIASFSKANHEL